MMDLVTCVRQYVAEMSRIAGPGMKVLLMDKYTTAVVSCAYSQSEMMHKEVYLFERLDSGLARDPIKYLKCVCLLRPTPENIDLLVVELRNPRYGQYYLYFSNIISKRDVKRLAEADEQECVREVNEFYTDYIPLAPHLFVLNLPNCYQALAMGQPAIRRCTSGLAGVLLSLKKQPVIRFQGSSSAAKSVAESVHNLLMNESKLFDFRRSDPAPLLLVLDRRDDPVTPLLNQWTYQAMVHELLGITNNRVSLADVPNVDQDMRQVVLSPLHDEFYAQNLYSNFGEIAENIKRLMEDFQSRAQTHKKLESVSDMKAFVEQYPQFKKISGTVTKHVTLISELSRLTVMYNLLEVSETEQLLACHDQHTQSLTMIRKLLSSEKTADLDAARLVMLYALRYEQHANNDITNLVHALRKRGVPDKYCKAVSDLLEFGGVRARSSDLYGSTATAASITKKFIKGLKGVDNIYTQHQPYLLTVLDQLTKNRLRLDAYPFTSATHNTNMTRVGDVIVFMVGGVTYEECLAVHTFNQQTQGVHVLLGGTTVHNARSFMDEVVTAAQGAIRRGGQAGPQSKKPLM